MIKKAVLLVDTTEAIDGVPAALVEISGVPLLRRIALDLRRAEINRIVVVLDKPDGAIEELLAQLGIKPLFKTNDDWQTEALEGRGEDALLLTANRLYDFRSLAALAGVRMNGYKALISIDLNPPGVWREVEGRYAVYNGKLLANDALEPQAFHDGRIGAYALTHQSLENAINLTEAERQECARLLVEQDGAAYFDVGNGFVQPIASHTDVREAGQRILRYVWKETDGVHARANKRLALPFIKLLLKTPVTPNMISVAGVFVSLAAGYFFSLGSYRYYLLGALVSYVSALFDHFDGSIARLKNMESAFGCYFEQVCDFAYYFSFALGVSVGLYRETNNQSYLFLGAAFFFGALAGLLTISYQRKEFAKNPSHLATQAQRKLEDNKQNPIYRFGRTAYFLAKRPVMPYYVFIFTVLGMLPFILFMAALGANLFWTIQLYSNRLFRQRAESVKT